jgi:hypothetical protein
VQKYKFMLEVVVEKKPNNNRSWNIAKGNLYKIIGQFNDNM